MTLLKPARLLAQAWTSQTLPSSSKRGHGSMIHLPGSTSTGGLHSPAGSTAVTA
jgi:hypothetical protein